MHRISIIVVLCLITLNLLLAFDVCPDSQYLNASGNCVDCTQCQSKEEKIRNCSPNFDTICGSFSSKSRKNKKVEEQSSDLKKSQANSVTKKSKFTFGESLDLYNVTLLSNSNMVKKILKDREIKNHTTNNTGILKPGHVELPMSKSSFNKNSKHIKKDLSKSKDSNQELSASLFKYVNSKSGNFSNKKSEPTMLDNHSKWLQYLVPHVENHEIYVDVEDDGSFYPESHSNSLNSSKIVAVRNNNVIKPVGSTENLKNETHLSSSTRIFYGTPTNNFDDEIIDNIDDDDAIDDDDDDDDEDDDDDDDDDDTDDGDNDDEEEEDEYKEEGNNLSSFVGMKDKYPPFGVDNTISTAPNDYDIGDDGIEDSIATNNDELLAFGSDVNITPYSDGNNWQLLILLSAATACLLFFVVVNAYLCIYLRKWKPMKQDFGADVDDLSVRTNLMQHAIFEADESNNVKNYITLLERGKCCAEKLQKGGSCA